MKPATAHPITNAGSIAFISAPNIRGACTGRSCSRGWLCTLQES
jgi:hypothetical protein